VILPGSYRTGLRDKALIIQPVKVAWAKLSAAAIEIQGRELQGNAWSDVTFEQ